MQYTNNRFKSVRYHYTLSYSKQRDTLTLKDPEGHTVFDVRPTDIVKIYRTGSIFLEFKLKDESSHFLSFGTAWDPNPKTPQNTPSDKRYDEAMQQWSNLLKEKGVKIQLPTSMVIMYVSLGALVVFVVLTGIILLLASS